MADTLSAVRIQGGLLPTDLLSKLATGRHAGQGSADYYLAAGESVREAANRVWAYLTGVWSSYRQAASHLPEGDTATSVTRDRWLLILLDQLGYGRVPTTPAGGIRVGERSFPVSHQWGPSPIHLLGAGVDLDRRSPGVAGAAKASPQSMVQELLNVSDDHLWAILSNGLILRLLRDSTSLVGASYVEFDLEAIFDGDLFSDFLVLYSLAHQSRLEVRDEAVGPQSCWLEEWRTTAIETGSRALNQLREGVADAIEILGTGALAHPANEDLRRRLRGEGSDALTVNDINHALLRVVYRLLFSFVAEDRGLLLSPAATPAARERYEDYFSTSRLRSLAVRRGGTRHSDLWRGLQLVWRGLGDPEGLPTIGIVGIGGIFQDGPLDVLGSAEISNDTLLRAVRSLALVTEPGSQVQRLVDYLNLDAEELGSIYEALLEFVPSWDAINRRYTLGTASGNDRKLTGSYYTPSSLIDALLDTALDPVLDRAVKSADPQEALLSLTVCDPSCGSGHFLVAAARRIGKRLAAVRSGDPEPPPEQVRQALRDVIGRCIYGVDINPLSAELAKVSLWLEAMEPGKPMAFLDAQIRVGNSLMGATPELIEAGIPDDAFKPIEGDEKPFATAVRRHNKNERVNEAQDALPGDGESQLSAAEWEALVHAPTDSLKDLYAQQEMFDEIERSEQLLQQKLIADAWTAAFLWPLNEDAPFPITDGTFRQLRETGLVDAETHEVVQALAREYQFFHWHLAFPHVFDRPGAGFDVVLSNPPWERVKLQEQEFFAARDPEVASAPNAAVRKRLIDKLADSNPTLHAEFIAARRRAEGESHFLRNSGRSPLTGRGDINTYAVFAELVRQILDEHGRVGIIVPTGIATDATTQFYFKDLVESSTLARLYDFENAKPLFDGVHRSYKFCLLTLAGTGDPQPQGQFAFFLHDPTDLRRTEVTFELTPEEIKLLNPNTGTCPIFRTRRDAEITIGIYKRVPVLINENDPVNGNPWGIRFMTMFHMSNDAHLFHTREELEDDGWVLNGNVFERPLHASNSDTPPQEFEYMMPLYEAKMMHHYDTRWATYEPDGSTRYMTEEEKARRTPPMPRYWVHEREVDRKLEDRWSRRWILGWRDVCRATDARTVISTLGPRLGYGHKWLLALPEVDGRLLQAIWSSFAFDFIARQKVGGTSLGYFTMMQLACPRPDQLESISPLLPTRASAWIASSVDRLNAGLSPKKRALLRAELDAAAFHIFGCDRHDTEHILNHFGIVQREEESEAGQFVTRDLILEAYDAFANARDGGTIFSRPWEDL